jgi:hypothetical protein
LDTLFENELAEACLGNLYSTMSVFHANIQEIETERNSLLEVFTSLQSVCQLLQHRIEEGSLSLKTQEIISKEKEDGLLKESDFTVREASSVYKVCFEYLLKWTVLFNEVSVFIG